MLLSVLHDVLPPDHPAGSHTDTKDTRIAQCCNELRRGLEHKVCMIMHVNRSIQLRSLRTSNCRRATWALLKMCGTPPTGGQALQRSSSSYMQIVPPNLRHMLGNLPLVGHQTRCTRCTHLHLFQLRRHAGCLVCGELSRSGEVSASDCCRDLLLVQPLSPDPSQESHLRARPCGSNDSSRAECCSEASVAHL